MSIIRSVIRPSAYYDSIVLMQLRHALLHLPHVVDAAVVMGTPANLALLADSDLLDTAADAATPNDLVIVLRADSESAAAAALDQVDALLSARRGRGEQTFRPRSLASALKTLPDAQWVLVSVAGRYAAPVARAALDAGRHVFLYSDNVPLADEIALKQTALEGGRLVMGPDCGTAIIHGVGLGFANRVRRGPIGLVGASGTGLQAVSAAVHTLGAGVSHALGTGSRDLSAEVGGVTTGQALDLLARDPDTEVIVLVSKPPSPDVAPRLLAAARATDKPVVVYFIGYPPPARQLGPLHFATTLGAAAALAVDLLHTKPARDRAPQLVPPRGPYLRGLLSGGTLAYEALLGLQAGLYPVYSNTPLRPEQRLRDAAHSEGHTLLDLGADEFTVGRLHPMLDNELRLRRFHQEAADPDVGIILLDVVLGDGAHPDPASELGLAIRLSQTAGGPEVVAVVVGTDEDPQDVSRQVGALTRSGATVFRTLTEAVEYVSARLGERPPPLPAPVALETLQRPLAAVNIGLELFYDSLVAQGAAAIHVDWRPPAGGDERLAALLGKMRQT